MRDFSPRPPLPFSLSVRSTSTLDQTQSFWCRVFVSPSYYKMFLFCNRLYSESGSRCTTDGAGEGGSYGLTIFKVDESSVHCLFFMAVDQR